METMLTQVPGKLRTKHVSLADTFTKRGFIMANDWEFPLTFYKKGGDREETERNRLDPKKCIKLRADQIEHIEHVARTEDDVLTLVQQIMETGEFEDPLKQRMQQMVEKETGALRVENEKLKAMNEALMEQMQKMLQRMEALVPTDTKAPPPAETPQPTTTTAGRPRPLKHRGKDASGAVTVPPQPEAPPVG